MFHENLHAWKSTVFYGNASGTIRSIVISFAFNETKRPTFEKSFSLRFFCFLKIHPEPKMGAISTSFVVIIYIHNRHNPRNPKSPISPKSHVGIHTNTHPRTTFPSTFFEACNSQQHSGFASALRSLADNGGLGQWSIRSTSAKASKGHALGRWWKKSPLTSPATLHFCTVDSLCGWFFFIVAKFSIGLSYESVWMLSRTVWYA